MEFVENKVFANADKVFLIVVDFNPEARCFYEKAGYHQVGEIPNLYRSGINEFLLVKE